jgi:hypothetical protein
MSKHLKVINEKRTHSTRGEGDYADWSEDIYNDIRELEIVDSDYSYRDVIADFDVKSGDIVFLVYALYSDGDSFGSSTGNIEYVAVYKSKEKAEACVKQINDSVDKSRNTYSMEYTTESGSVLTVSCPWIGYFNRLESAEVRRLIVY